MRAYAVVPTEEDYWRRTPDPFDPEFAKAAAAAFAKSIGKTLDDPGRPGDGENYNIGFTDVTDGVYAEMVQAALEVHRELYPRRAGPLTPP